MSNFTEETVLSVRHWTDDLFSFSFRVPLGGVVPWLACVVIVWLLTGLTRGEWLAFGVCLTAGTLVYLGTSERRLPAASA